MEITKVRLLMFSVYQKLGANDLLGRFRHRIRTLANVTVCLEIRPVGPVKSDRFYRTFDIAATKPYTSHVLSWNKVQSKSEHRNKDLRTFSLTYIYMTFRGNLF